MSEDTNKKGAKVSSWLLIGMVLFAILLNWLFWDSNTGNSPTKVSEKESLSYSDTILIANDSIKDRLYAEYGLQVKAAKIGWFLGGIGIRFYFDIKMKNLRDEEINGGVSIAYKVKDLKTDEIVYTNKGYIGYERFLPGEVHSKDLRLEYEFSPSIRQQYPNHELYIWINDIPMSPFILDRKLLN